MIYCFLLPFFIVIDVLHHFAAFVIELPDTDALALVKAAFVMLLPVFMPGPAPAVIFPFKKLPFAPLLAIFAPVYPFAMFQMCRIVPCLS